MSLSRDYYLSAIASVCHGICEQIDVKSTLEHMAEQQSRYEKCLQNFMWYARLGARLPENASSPSRRAMSSPGPAAMNGWDMGVITAILQKLDYSLKDKQSDLRAFMKNNLSADVRNKVSDSEAIIHFLKEANLFFAMQYILAISLLTGGKGAAELDLVELVELLKKAKLKWTDFFSKHNPVSHYAMAVEKDDPANLLAILERKKFLFQDILIRIDNKNLVEYLFENAKKNILLAIFNDLTKDEILRIKNLDELLANLAHEGLLNVIHEKMSSGSQSENKNHSVTKLLSSMKNMIEKALLKNTLSEDLLQFANRLVESIESELASSVFNLDEALFNSFLIFLEKFKLDNKHYHAVLEVKPVSYSEEHQLVASARLFHHNPYYATYHEKHAHLVQSMSSSHPELPTILIELQTWLESAIDYHHSKDIEKNKDHYQVGWVLKKFYTLVLAFEVNFLNVPAFALQLHKLDDLLKSSPIHSARMTDLNSVLKQFSVVFNVAIHNEATAIMARQNEASALSDLEAKHWGIALHKKDAGWYDKATVAIMETAASVDSMMKDAHSSASSHVV